MHNYSRRRAEKERVVWCKKWLLNRSRYSHINFTNELASADEIDLRNYLRQDVDVSSDPLSLVNSSII